jgi:type II secretory ATPase GspE/PulE/Tfp pilus assembly ATPase PilB-like protein
MATDSFLVRRPALCWNCSTEFDPVNAEWCAHDPRLPNKVCPHCGECFCSAGEKLKQEFWRRAPAELLDEFELLARRRERFATRLVESGRLTMRGLVTALRAQSHWPQEEGLDDILLQLSLASREDVQAARAETGERTLADTNGHPYPPPVLGCGKDGPEGIFEYVLSLAAHRGAAELHLEPKADGLGVRFRIDGVSFRLDPIPLAASQGLLTHVLESFGFVPGRPPGPERARRRFVLQGSEYDLVAHLLPTRHGPSLTVRFIERATFIKDFTGLGLDLDDRMRLVSALRRGSGLVVVAAPLLEGGNTTAYSMMDFLVQARREVVSLESPLLWEVEGARQVELGDLWQTAGALQAIVAVRPDAAVVFSLPDPQSALVATQLAASMVVVCKVPAAGAIQALMTLLDMGVPRHLLAANIAAVSAQRLVRRLCRICRQTVPPPPEPLLAQAGVDSTDAARISFWRGKGCPSCNRVGFRGRQALFEVLSSTAELTAGLSRGLDPNELETLARAGGMRPLRDRALEAVGRGLTSFEEFEALRL